MMLDSASPVPLYKQLAEHLRNQILNEELKSGQKLPSENELCTMFNVSRVTVRKAIDDLECDGTIIRRQGKGTYVHLQKLSEQPYDNPSFSSVIKEYGLTMETKILEMSILPAGEKQQQEFGLTAGAKIIKIKRLRYVEGTPILIEMSQFNDRFMGIITHDLEKESVYEILKSNFGIQRLKARKTIEVTMVTNEEAKLLDIKRRTHVLLMRETVYDENDQFVHYTKQLIIGDRYRFEIY